MLIFLISIIFFGCYLLIFITAIIGFVICNEEPLVDAKPYTVVIAARNEQRFIIRCLEAIVGQSALPDEVIIVDDHSEDNTFSFAQAFGLHSIVKIRIINAPDTCVGKKQCIALALNEAKTDIVLQTDADSEPQPKWAISLLSSLSNRHRLVFSPVIYFKSKLKHGLIQAEYIGLMAMSSGLARAGRPTMVSGASMAFFRSDYLNYVMAGLGNRHLSGDDIFFMQYLELIYGRQAMCIIDKKNSLVYTAPPESAGEWLKQRVRWASKSSSYKGWFHWLLPALVLIGNLSWMIAILSLSLSDIPNYMLLSVVLSKPIFEIIAPLIASIKWKKYEIIFWLPWVSLLYPLFLAVVLLSSSLLKHSWKGRPLFKQP